MPANGLRRDWKTVLPRTFHPREYIIWREMFRRNTSGVDYTALWTPQECQIQVDINDESWIAREHRAS